jgi:DNA-binding transcriptional MerR regulator
METIQHRDVVKIFPGITSRTSINWSDKGLFEPAVQASGTGTRREYSIYNLVEIGVIIQLRSYGLRNNPISNHLKKMEEVMRPLDYLAFDFGMIVRPRKPDIDFLGGRIGGEVYESMETILLRKESFNSMRFDNIFGDLPGAEGEGRAYSALAVDIQEIYYYVRERLNGI